jgi:ATP-binding cassette subfamily B protein
MTEAERRRNYLYMLLSGKDAAKELRAFGLGGFLRERFDRLYDEHLAELRKVARRRLRVSLLGNLATTVVLAGIVASLLVLALNGRIGLADAGTAAGAVFVLGERLMNAVFSSGMLYESSLFIEDFTSFVAMAPEVEARRSRDPAPAGFRRLQVEGVSFTYPSATTPAVTGVSMEIGAGEIVALIGENGSGKTTLAKLLCRLYLPQEGRVLWDGVDTATVDPDGLRRSVAVIFQDFLHYSLPAAENFGMGGHQRLGDTGPSGGRRSTPAPTSSWPGCPRAMRPCSGPSSKGAGSCRSASGSGSPWPGRSSATPRSSSSTSRPPPLTPGPSTSCSRASGPCAGAGRCC